MPDEAKFDPVSIIARELALGPASISAVLGLLEAGNTVPFIARYRKEATQGLDEVAIRAIQERGDYLLELEKRKQVILGSIRDQGVLSPELSAAIAACETKAALEDLYLPYKPKRRTRATTARERGLEPLAALVRNQPDFGDPLAAAASYIDIEREVESAQAALGGARDIIAEQIAEDARLRAQARESFVRDGVLASSIIEGKEDEAAKFADYFSYTEKVCGIPSHRYLAVRRAEREGFLKVRLEIDEEPLLARALTCFEHRPSSPFASQLEAAARDGIRRLLIPSVESDVRVELKLAADRDAVEVFASNLRALLLAAPLGAKPVVGVDPGLRTGCKCAAVDATGAFRENTTFNMVASERAVEEGQEKLAAFIRKTTPVAVAVGNGTGGREAERFVRRTIEAAGIRDVVVVPISEAGASVYSASEIAGREFPQLDLTVRGAISIARRLQDPLAELVKIEPKAIGVGQYQHDVHQPLLSRKLEEVVESCVNAVGVDLNTASAPLLARVAGIGPKTAEAIVEHRTKSGGFRSRKQLLKVKGLGPKAFEQAAGFLRIRDGENPLDGSAVHPERYELVERIAGDMRVSLSALVGDEALANRIDPARYVGGEVGMPTLEDIIFELKKPGRDPREEFTPPAFREDVNTIADLRVGMELEGVVTNVTNFGAFVDVGVHRDGLVHVSQLADRFVRDPAEVVKVGDRLKVRVLEVDTKRERISFTARKEQARGDGEAAQRKERETTRAKREAPSRTPPRQFSYNPFEALSKRRG